MSLATKTFIVVSSSSSTTTTFDHDFECVAKDTVFVILAIYTVVIRVSRTFVGRKEDWMGEGVMSLLVSQG
ncbi:hypothetical protein K505DRAFT_77585 [Melanomma pulvis-pyrius CBS 109.77]|uniref:Uncharacterized protein n=1 Tax=Melanomma pulvis-pyrius CBS 109.77 TaxID=1314802 RepID=A0A6A6X2M7_9PLEO|nr:hypothetical protein K505DRAFT_77585 [Melanomma pulvis-pyrius CBS 109.77]